MILVTGASGFVGRHLVKELLRQNYQVGCFVRKTSDISQLSGEIFYGDVTDKNSLIEATKGIGSVIHLAAIVGFGDQRLNYKIHVIGAQNLIDACKINGVKRVIVTSSVATLAERKSDYGMTKAMADDLFLSSGLDVTILKPDFIYGKDGRGFLALVNVIKKHRFVPIMGHGNNRRHPVHVGDVVDVIIKCLENKKSIGKTYMVASSKPIRFNKMVDMIIKKTGQKKIKLRFPIWLAMLGAYIMKIKKNPPLTKTIVLGISQDRVIDNSQMVNELGVKPRSFEEGLEESL